MLGLLTRIAVALILAASLQTSASLGQDVFSEFDAESHSDCETFRFAAAEIFARNVGLLRAPDESATAFSPNSFESRLTNAAWEIGEDGLFRVKSAWEPLNAQSSKIQPWSIVKNTTEFPYCAVCRLKIRFSNFGGKTRTVDGGTAFFVGPKLLLTNAHLLTFRTYDLSPGQSDPGEQWFAELIHVFPAQDERKRKQLPYGKDIAGDEIGPVWTTEAYNFAIENDYGWIHLPDNSLHRQLPERFHFELAAWSDKKLAAAMVDYAGYPGVPGNIVMRESKSRIREVQESVFYHNMQTRGGASGSPIYVCTSVKNNTWTVVGIHTGGRIATRITDKIIQRTKALRKNPNN